MQTVEIRYVYCKGMIGALFPSKHHPSIYPTHGFSNHYQCQLKVIDKQWPGIDAIRTKVPPSKPKWEITKITISRTTKRTYGKPNKQLSPKRWSLSYLNLTKYHLNTQKVKTVQKLTLKQANTDNKIRSTTLEQSVI